MKFAIVTVTYNDAKNLTQTMASVQGQTGADFVHIVVDGGSTDSTPEVFETLGREQDKFFSVTDSGVYDAMNQAIILLEDIAFDYFVFMNAQDTFFEDTTLQKIAASLDKSGRKPDIVIGPYDYVKGRGCEIRNTPAAPATLLKALKDNRLSDCLGAMPGHQATYYAKSYIKGKAYDLSYQIAADHDLFLKAVMDGADIYNLLFPLCRYYSGGFSAQNLNRLDAEWMRIYVGAGASEREGMREFHRRNRSLPDGNRRIADNARLLDRGQHQVEKSIVEGDGFGRWLGQNQLVALIADTSLLMMSLRNALEDQSLSVSIDGEHRCDIALEADISKLQDVLVPVGRGHSLVELNFRQAGPQPGADEGGMDEALVSAYLTNLQAVKSFAMSAVDLLAEDQSSLLADITEGTLQINQGTRANPVTTVLSFDRDSVGEHKTAILVDVEAMEGELSVYSDNDQLFGKIEHAGQHILEIPPSDKLCFSVSPSEADGTAAATISSLQIIGWRESARG